MMNTNNSNQNKALISPYQFLQDVISEVTSSEIKLSNDYSNLTRRISNLTKNRIIGGLVDISVEKSTNNMSSPSKFAECVDEVLDFVSNKTKDQLVEYVVKLCLMDVRHARFFK